MTSNGASPVQCRDLTFSYGVNPVLRGVSFSVPPRAFFGLVGPNGCGKSTVMRLLLGLLEPTGGSLEVLGRPPLEAVRTGEVGYVPQRETYQRSFPLSVQDVVMMGRSGRSGAGHRFRGDDKRAAQEALERLGLLPLRRQAFGSLSGGQQRLVLLGRALAQQPKLLLMDEADTGLDSRRRAMIYHELDLLRHERDLTVLAISHQLDLLAQVVDGAVALSDGRGVEWCPDCMHHARGDALPAHAGNRW